jgi:hypothetical protein
VRALERELGTRVIGELRGKALDKLGCGAGATIDPAVHAALDQALDVAAKVVRPAGTYRILPVLDATAKSVQTQAGTIRSALFTRLVKMCEGDPSIVFMISTLGEELEKGCGPAEPLVRQLVFDTVGSELAEMVADGLEADWRAELDALGLQCSERFSPGYCDWALEGQAVIAAAIDIDRVGVRLNSHFVMTPRKSVSAVAVTAREVPAPGPCVFCARDDCSSRRWPRRKTTRAQPESSSIEAD